jgi:hypothetical protein
MGVAAADQNEILSDRNAVLHRRHYARAAGEKRAGGLLAISLLAGKIRSGVAKSPESALYQ